MNYRTLVHSSIDQTPIRFAVAIASLACWTPLAFALPAAQSSSQHHAQHAQPFIPYTITPLGNQALAIDATGSVALTQGTQAFVFTPPTPHATTGNITPLGTLGGTTSIGESINALGNIAGFSTLASGHYRAFLFSNGTLTDIGSLSNDFSSATAINAVGQIVGFSYTASDDEHAFLWTADAPNGTTGSMIDLGTLGGEYSEAHAINVHGDVTGYAYLPNGAFHAFRYTDGRMSDLGTLGGDFSKGHAINDAGLIAGEGYLPGNVGTHACLWNGTITRDLGGLGGAYSTALAIDSSGARIVGQATVPNGGQYLVYHAFLYTAGSLQDLNAAIPAGSGWILESAQGINDSGQIVGTGTFNGQQRGYLLTPH